jgi:uncharacterized membrane protein YdfJ with MMPL/SSD domain
MPTEQKEHPMMHVEKGNNLAARMGGWSATHRKTAIIGWLAFVAVVFLVGSAMGTKNLKPSDAGSGESGHVERVLGHHFAQPKGDSILIQSKDTTVDDPVFQAAVLDVTTTLADLAQVRDVKSPYAAGNESQLSGDRHSALVSVLLRTSDLDEAKKLDVAVEKAVRAADTRHAGITIEEFGINAENQVDKAVQQDFAKAGVVSLPITLIVLVFTFGALVAAGLPLLLALSSVIATTGLLALPSRLLPLDPDIGVIVLLVGLAVGVDYAMFYLKRAREERAAGRSQTAALAAAAATSGRSVLVSGLTVMVAMGGMLFTGDRTFMGFGIATMIVVAIAMLGSLTVLPATMAALGDRVGKLRIPFIGRSPHAGRGRGWNVILDRVLRRPAVSVVLATGALLALAVPALHLHLASPDVTTLPQNLSAVQTYNKMHHAFPANGNSAQVMIRTQDTGTSTVQTAIADLKRRAIATGQFSAPTDVDYSPDGSIALVSIAMQGTGVSHGAMSALHTLRDKVVPATVGHLDNADVGVSGPTAIEADSNDQMTSAAPYVFGFVLTLAFLLMLLTFRSIVIAIKAVLLNLLSVAAAYGALVLVFQDGWGKQLLGFQQTGGIIGFLPIFLFVILFGLSMDYHVFILSRIRESFDRGMPTDQAVTHGIKSSAGVVTSAAVVMFGVFSVFATLHFMFLKQFGVGLAIAVLVDATVVRAVLLPASMKLLGDWNWYLPAWLRWLPRVGHEGSSGEHGAPSDPVVPVSSEMVDAAR